MLYEACSSTSTPVSTNYQLRAWWWRQRLAWLHLWLLGRPMVDDIRPLHLLLTACQLISHNFELMKCGCCNVQTSKNSHIWQVLPDNKCCQMWLILWLFENFCGCWQKQQPRKENFSKQKLHFHHRWKCSKKLDFQATFWQSLAGPYFCRFLSMLSHMWTEFSVLAKIQTAKATFMVKYFIQ